MFRKTLTIFTLGAFLAQVLFNDLVWAQNQPKPTFEEIYKHYSFIQVATLSTITKYAPEDIAKERKKLEEKERKEKEAAKKEQLAVKVQLKEYQSQLKKNSDAVGKISRKYRTEEVIYEDGKPRKVSQIDHRALDQDTDYQSLQTERKKLECQIKEWEIKSNEEVYRIKLEHIKIFYEVLQTQLDLLQYWPEHLAQIEADVASGKADQRPFANPENIGLRNLGFGNQGEDIRIWQNPEVKKFLEDLRLKEYKNPAVKAYLVGLVKTIAANTDLKIPIEDQNIMISEEEDVNAFALPGGIISVNRGLLLKADTEAELAGVIAHELAHVAARHSARMYKKAQIAGIIYQAAQIAAIIFTGGAASLAMYYGLQGIFTGLGMLISLKLLGVNREYELEADTLGMQYVWKTSYDPMSFMNFFEKMGRDKGYIRGNSFFRTHPPFEERVVNAYREEHFLPPKDAYVSNTTAFLEMKARLCVALEIEKKEEQDLQNRQYRPTLTRKEKQEEEHTRRDCGLQKPNINEGPSPCDDPSLEEFKQRVREELLRNPTPKDTTEEDKSRPTIRRPRP